MKYLLVALPLIPLALFLLLSGCSTRPEIIIQAPPEVHRQALKDIVPDSSMTCLPEPDGAAAVTVRQAARYVVGVKKAGQDCRQKLSSVRKIIQSEQ